MRKSRAVSAHSLFYFTGVMVCLLFCSNAMAQSDSTFEKLNRLYVSAVRSGNNYLVNQGKSWALFNHSGKPMTAFMYEKMTSGFNGDVVVSMKEGSPKLLDSAGLLKTLFHQPNVYLRPATKQYVGYSYENAQHLKKFVYDENGAIILNYTENPEDKKEIISTGDNSKYFIRDTNGQFISNRHFEDLEIGPNFIVATSDDSSFIINKSGKILFQTNGQSIVPIDDHYFAMRNKVFWLLIDSNGKRHTDKRFYSLGKAGISGFAGADNNIIQTATGKPVLEDTYIQQIYKRGNWYELDAANSSENIIADEHLKPLFTELNYEEVEFIGPRFALLSYRYDDPNPIVYDRFSGKNIKLRIKQHIKDDFYYTEERKTQLKRLTKGVKQLPVTPFQNIEEVNHGPFYRINNEKPSSEEPESSFQLVITEYAESFVTGILDSQMKEIIPMKYHQIAIHSNNVILTTDAQGHKQLFDAKGKLLFALQANQQVFRSGAVIHIYSGDGSVLLDSLGKVLYKGKANIQLLFAERGEALPSTFPSLLMFEDSSGMAGVYDLKLKQILAHQFFKVKDKMDGTFALKKGDSVYYINSHGHFLFAGRGFQNQKLIFLPGYALILQNEAGKYGTMAADGNIILPFEYDTVYRAAHGYAIGKQGRFAMLNDVGQLSYPLQQWAPVDKHQYGFLKSSDGKYYAINKGQVQEAKLSINSNLWQDMFRHHGLFIYIEAGNEFNFQKGIYNHSGKRIAEYKAGHDYRINGIEMLVPANDSNQLNLIDTSGKILIAGLNKKAIIHFYPDAILLVDTNGTDELYRKEAGAYKKSEIEIFKEDEQNILKHFKQNYNLSGFSFRFKTDLVSNALITTKGEVFMDPRVEKISVFENVYLITHSGKYGLMNYMTEWIQKPDADSIIKVKTGMFNIYKNNKKGVFKPGARLAYVPPYYDQIYKPNSNHDIKVVLVRKGNQYNLIDQEGKELLPWMDSISTRITKVEHTAAYIKGKEVSLNYNDEGEVIIDSNEKKQVQYESISGFREQVAIVAADKQYGLYNNKNYHYILPIRYDGIKLSEKGKYYFAWRYKEDKLAGIDSTIVVNQKGDIILRQKGFMAATDVIPGVIEPLNSQSNSPKLPEGYSVIKQLSNSSLWLVQKNNKKTLATPKGKILFSPTYTDIDDNELEDDYLIGAKDVSIDSEVDSRYALISPEGRILSKAIYDEIEDNELSETCVKPCFIVLKNDLYGIINDKGKQILEAKYDEISGVYNNEIALLKKGEFWGALNLRNGKVILDFQYDEIKLKRDGNLGATKGNETILFDRKGDKLKAQYLPY